jgi:hypothetical protein
MSNVKIVHLKSSLKAVLRIRIHVFLGLLDPDPLVRGMDPDPYHKAKMVRKTLISTVL